MTASPDALPDGLAFRDRACYLADANALVLADLHVGLAARSDVAFPLGERADLVDRFEALIDAFEPDEAVFAGDVLHSFSDVPDPVPETLSGLKRAAREAGVRLVVTPGNHDAMLASLWDGPAPDEYRLTEHAGGTLVCHGHECPDGAAARYVIGHDHPVVEIEGRRRPCYLLGEYDGSEVVMLPAFTRLAAGASVNGMSARDFQSPLVVDADALRPIVRDEERDETLAFPPLGKFRRML